MPNPKKGLSAGKVAPDFTLVPALSEELVHLSDYLGRWVVLLFFRGLI
jgi:peroxiredoxin